ncbi:MAG TPA: PilZ domain-containing protein [Nitrospira sp.]|nr:PilZ domain-containing protein [Nitrospira sp.]
MGSLVNAMPHQNVAGPSDDRREWLRIDDQVLLEYRLTTEPTDAPIPEEFRATPESITLSIAKPTAELLARSGDALQDSLLVPWLKKIDWLLELTLKTLAASNPGRVPMARVMPVNLSGGGVSFVTTRKLEVGQDLALKLILPPFTPIQTTARITRVTACRDAGAGFEIGTEFVAINPDDQEALIRHILTTQAERLRARRAGASPLR